MTVIVSLLGARADVPPLSRQRHPALLPVAGSTMLGLMLDLLAPLGLEDLHLLIDGPAATVAAWLAEHRPALTPGYLAVPAGTPLGPALARHENVIEPAAPFLLVLGDSLYRVPPAAVREPTAFWLVAPAGRASGLERPGATVAADGRILSVAAGGATEPLAGLFWFPRGDPVRAALSQDPARAAESLSGWLTGLLDVLGPIRAVAADEWESAADRGQLLRTNARLLAVNYGSSDALERSFAEGFTVLPPIYLHETAEVDGAVLGPYVSIGPGAQIRQAVIRNSIIDAGARIAACVVDGAIIGARARVEGAVLSPVIGDDGELIEGPAAPGS